MGTTLGLRARPYAPLQQPKEKSRWATFRFHKRIERRNRKGITLEYSNAPVHW